MSRVTGFTLIELMITVSLVAILMMIAAPSLRDVMWNARMTSATNDLITDLSVARAEAVTRGVPTAICTSNTGAACTATAWSQGWIIFYDPDGDGALTDAPPTCSPQSACIAKIAPAIAGAANVPPTTIVSVGHSVNAGAQYVGFRPSGVVTKGGAGPAVVFTLCDARTTAAFGEPAARDKGRQVTVSATGRAISQRATCP